MEKPTNKSLNHILKVSDVHLNHLYDLRNWSQLKGCVHENHIWISGIDSDLLTSSAVTSIPFKSIYRLEDGQLYKIGRSLPYTTMPELNWQKLTTVLPIENFSLNPNFFNLNQSVELKLTHSHYEQKVSATIMPLEPNKDVILNQPAFRLKNKSYTILNGKELFVLGAPVLPCNADDYWQKGMMFLPLGYDFNYSILADSLFEKLVPDSDALIVWNVDSSYFLINTNELTKLSVSSLRLTLKELAI